jgi:hypothetical protein
VMTGTALPQMDMLSEQRNLLGARAKTGQAAI